MKTNIELVEAQLEAYNKGDIEAFCACYHPDVVVKKFLEDTVVMEGLSEFKPLYDQLFKTHFNQKCHVKSRIIKGDVIIDEEYITGRETHPDGIYAVAIYGFRSGLIDRVWFL